MELRVQHRADIAIRRDGHFVWINVDGDCVLRIIIPPECEPISLDDRRIRKLCVDNPT
jgi:hypothetical protein